MPFLQIAIKELKELLRDRRNTILSILLPILMILIIGGISAFVAKSPKHDNNIIIATDNSTIYNLLLNEDSKYDVVQLSIPDIKEGVEDKKFQLGLINENSNGKAIALANDDSKENIYFNSFIENINNTLSKSNINSKTDLQIEYVSKDYAGTVSKTVSVIISYVIMLLVMRINNSNAYYLTTKEKSSGTLELLFITPLKKHTIILGKWISNFISCYLISVIILIPIYVLLTLLFKFTIHIDLNLLYKLPIVLIELLGFCLTFSIFQLVLGFIAKTRKETQLYLVYAPWILFLPLTVVFAMDSATLSVYSNSIHWLTFIPIINFYDIIQMSMMSIINYFKIIIILSTNIITCFLMFMSLIKMFGKESILFFED